jgi:hypothetical protein
VTQPPISEDDIVSTVIAQLRPNIVRIIRVSVESSGVNLSNYDTLVEDIIVQLRPVVSGAVQAAVSGSAGLNADNLKEKIIQQLRPFVVEGVQKEVIQIQGQSSAPALSEEQESILRISVSAENFSDKFL